MRYPLPAALAAAFVILASCSAEKPCYMDAEDVQKIAEEEGKTVQDVLFDDGNYAMFIHFGLYSKLEGEWKGRTYPGAAEWIMNYNQAGIPVDEYMAEAATFNPASFDAEEIVSIAKDAGMKYIVITSKHHEGFAMFDSEVCDFNIADATPFGRDVIGELAEACHRNGMGIGFYYSQFQDWTAPGGGNGPKTDAEGREVSFDEYFRTKCVPQVEEITTRYGDVQLIWFDTPGNMSAEYSRELVDLVKKNQPGCLVSSRVGNDMGDYRTLGDMEVPIANIEGRWEGIDVTQVGWGYSKNDNQWKSPEYIVKTLVSTVARGGTFMLNVGPTAEGKIHDNAAASLRKAGEWVHAHPQAVYRAEASPWGRALPWGDAVVNGGKLYLTVFDWPSDGRLWIPGMKSGVKAARIVGGRKVKSSREGQWTCLHVPAAMPDAIATVIEVVPDGPVEVEGGLYADPSMPTQLSVLSAETKECRTSKQGWMENFGEWKFKNVVKNMTPESEIAWTVCFKNAGVYEIGLEYNGQDRHEWKLALDGIDVLQNNLGSAASYDWHTMGWLTIDSPGPHVLTLRVSDGDPGDLKLASLSTVPILL